ncbi:trypsin-7-like [Pectinophora gossypiella]|uniref:trypsin-7-like n=1 Tax=Pectinophora gossypiella TaxID=13191 RepID=UPI00214F1938|nr:trypsin-7-like [Pectinophora gossypiella]
MAGVHKMAAVILFLNALLFVNCHRDDASDASSDSTSSEHADFTAVPDRTRNGRRSQKKEWQYEGLPIDIPKRRADPPTTTTTTTPTTTTTAVYPPLNPRFRRIYNPDERASIDEYPFLAAVLVNKELWCGGVIIDRDRVLTAAHCLQLQYNNRFFREYVKMLTVRVGSTNATAGGEVLKVVGITFHPNYKPSTLEFNAAVLQLHKNLTFETREPYFVTKTPYARENAIAVDNTVVFLGWGSVLGGGGTGGSVLLQKVELPVYDFSDCQQIYGKVLLTRTNFCAGYITLPKNVCNHDAGGPAILDGVLVGILSYSSKRCDQPDQPAVFTSVGALSPWLDDLNEPKPR